MTDCESRAGLTYKGKRLAFYADTARFVAGGQTKSDARPTAGAGGIEIGVEELTKQEYLWQYRDAGREVSRLEEEIARWRSRAESTTATIKQAPVRGDATDKLQAAVIAMDELGAKLAEAQGRLIALREEIGGAIDSVPDERLRLLLRLRYIDGLTWEQVAERMGRQTRWVKTLHGRALFSIRTL